MGARSGLHFYQKMLIVAVILFVAENMFFGWNKTAQSQPEEWADAIVAVLFFFGVMGSIVVEAVHEAVKRMNINIEQKEEVVNPCGSCQKHCHFHTMPNPHRHDVSCPYETGTHKCGENVC